MKSEIPTMHCDRQIMFRLWDFENRVMIYPSLSFSEKYVLQINCEYMGRFNGSTYDTIKMPKMQYTGLKDTTGVRIYEGDIINSNYFHNGIVEMWDYMWVCNSNESLHTFRTANHSFAVIGNIYENPELLK